MQLAPLLSKVAEVSSDIGHLPMIASVAVSRGTQNGNALSSHEGKTVT